MAKLVEGFKQALFIAKESAFNTAADVSSSDGCMLTEMKLEPNQEFVENESHVGTASPQGPGVKGKFNGTWSVAGYLQVPSSGTPADLDDSMKAILEATFGQVDPSGGALTYSSTDENPQSLTMVKAAGDGFWNKATGCVVESLELDMTGGEIPSFTASGKFCGFAYCYGATADSANGDDITLSAADAGKISKGAKIKIANSGGYSVTAVSGSVITVSPTPTVSGGEAITPDYPAPAMSTDIMDGVSCSLKVNSTSMGFISGKVSLSTGNTLTEQEATSAFPTAGVKGAKREVTGSVSVYFSDENAAHIGKSLEGALSTVELQCGTESGKTCKISMPSVRIEPVVAEVPGADVATAEMSIRAYQDSSPGDELELKIS
tara:strand:- start:189 stop:1319 length:1131 start_codon:yes stop_codon:yes gene_type:complete